jgi:hypothetical protein
MNGRPADHYSCRSARILRPSPTQFLRRALALVLVAFLSTGFAACQEPSPNEIIATGPVSDSSFHSCVDREVKAAVDRAAQTGDGLSIYGYHTNIENDIISICNPQLKRETVQDNLSSSNSVYSYLNAAVEAQTQTVINDNIRLEVEVDRQKAEQDAPRIKVEEAEETNAGAAYLYCLEAHARTLAINSNEPAETIVQASFPSCLEERQVIFDVYRRHNKDFAEESMDIAENGWRRTLLLEVIKARAQPVTHPAPTPTKPETPI